MTGVLECAGVSVSYGAFCAVDRVSLEVTTGTIFGLVGPNGAGKTSLVDAISGFTPLSSGAVRFCGRDVSKLRPYARARLGLARTWQAAELFEDLSVRDNLRVAAQIGGWRATALDLLRPSRRGGVEVSDLVERFDLHGHLDALPSDLPNGLRRVVGVARALATRPKLLLLDEPAAGLDSSETSKLAVHLREIANSGLPLLLIDHDISFVWSVSDEVAVLDFGVVIAQGSPEIVRNDKRVIDAYLGAPK